MYPPVNTNRTKLMHVITKLNVPTFNDTTYVFDEISQARYFELVQGDPLSVTNSLQCKIAQFPVDLRNAFNKDRQVNNATTINN